MTTCRHCGNEWKPGGQWHGPTCPILTGQVSTLDILKKRKARKYQSVETLPEELTRVEPLKGFEKP